MSEDLLTLLKFVFLALLFLFLWAVVRVVLRELRAPALAPTGTAPTATTDKPKKAAASKSFATLRVLAPEARRGELVPIDNEITVGPAAAARSSSPTTSTRRRCTRACSGAATTSSSTTSSRGTARS